jgi:hypothetical protein
MNVFWTGSDGGLDEALWNGSAWSGPAEVPATPNALTSAPSAMTDVANGSIDVFASGTNGGLDESSWDGSAWSGPAQVPATSGKLGSAPSAMQGTSTVDVFWRGYDGGIWENWYDTAWHGPAEIPGTGTSTPPVAVTLPVPSASPPAKPGAPRPRRRVRVLFVIKWRWSGARTRLVAIHARGVPAHGSVSVACAGRGCPWGKLAAGRGSVPRLLRSLAGRVLSAGDRLTVTARAPNMVTQRIEIRIRDGVVPKARLL